jgi:phage terminase large subunit-like protein
MAKKKVLSEEQLEQRRRAAAQGAAAPHVESCACRPCYFRARKVAREGGGDATFQPYADWRAAQELQRARDRVVVDEPVLDRDLRADGRRDEGEGEEFMPPKPGTRVVTLEDQSRLFIAGDAEALRLERDSAAWIDKNILVSELGKPFQLTDYQRRVLKLMFVFDEDGKLSIDEALWSEPKKSGKTSMAAILGLWWADCHEAPNEILVVANDLEQATSRAFATMCQLLQRNPELGQRAKRASNTSIKFTTGTTIKAIASEYAGAAGSNHGLTIWDEIWAATSENYRRLWDELTPIPTRLNSIRLVFSYAGFEGESKTLQQLYFAGVDKAEHPEGRGERVDEELPIYRSKEGAGLNLVTFWSHECRMSWQTPKWLERQRQDHIAKGRVSTWLRLFENRWVSGESMFITAELWDAIVDNRLAPAIPSKGGAKLFVGVDVGIKNDTTGIVAVKKVKAADGTNRIQLVAHRIFTPKPGTPVDHADIAAYLRWLHRSFSVAKIAVDPHQALELCGYLKREGLPIEEVPQTSGTIDEMGQTLITAIQSRELVVYADAELRQQALNTVAIEMPSGMMRMSKVKSNRKIDAIVALALALRQLAVKPESWGHLESWSHTRTTSETAQGIAGARAGDGFIPGSGGRFVSKSGEIHYDPRYS